MRSHTPLFSGPTNTLFSSPIKVRSHKSSFWTLNVLAGTLPCVVTPSVLVGTLFGVGDPVFSLANCSMLHVDTIYNGPNSSTNRYCPHCPLHIVIGNFKKWLQGRFFETIKNKCFVPLRWNFTIVRLVIIYNNNNNNNN